jgi:GH24 family phage-related lysozyme (muramidase)
MAKKTAKEAKEMTARQIEQEREKLAREVEKLIEPLLKEEPMSRKLWKLARDYNLGAKRREPTPEEKFAFFLAKGLYAAAVGR